MCLTSQTTVFLAFSLVLNMTHASLLCLAMKDPFYPLAEKKAPTAFIVTFYQHSNDELSIKVRVDFLPLGDGLHS